MSFSMAIKPCATTPEADPVSVLEDEKKQEQEYEMRYRQHEWPSLYANPDFLVLYISDDGNMTMIRPADAPEHRKNMEKQRGHYALSHLWGNAKDYPYWDVGTFIHDWDGKPVEPIPMRPEKRNTLLALLKAYPGYWWIDVLCARVDTPLVIMGSIYRSCKTCFALLDCPVETIHRLSKRHLMPIRNDIFTTLMKFYKVFIKASNDGLDEQSAHKLISPAATTHFEKLMTYQDEIQAMRDLLECGWFSRIWTLQELVLPTKLVIFPEQFQDNVDIHEDQAEFGIINDITSALQLEGFEDYLDDEVRIVYQKVYVPIVEWLAQKLDSSLEGSYICNDELSMVSRLDQIQDVFDSLSGSPRTCMDPLDYVYGILGLLNLDIPRIDNADGLWAIFLSKLEERLTQMVNDITEDVNVSFTLSKSARDIKLIEAKHVSEVYNGLLTLEFDECAVALVLKDTEKTNRMAPQHEDMTVDDLAISNEFCDILNSMSDVLNRIASE
ncbi:hypothetical protein K492DRAFT_233032 [Lichtheimia hyalospora FSU 10163]|nr:hypothetical protein K492DRAFT_233032 [Lichtheimia hyalospora FSU 10163]